MNLDEKELEELRKQEQLKHLKNIQMPEAQVFYENPGDETRHTLYGKPKIGHWGFDSIEGFSKGISNLKKEIEDYNTLLKDNQAKLKAIVQDMDLYQNHPEIALPGEIEDLKNKYVSLMDKKNRILEKKTKEEKNLEILTKAKEEYNKNRINRLKTEDDKEKASLLNQLAAAEREMKNLEIKINGGTANNFEKERYEVLKNEIIPELFELINKNKVEELQQEEPEKQVPEQEVEEPEKQVPEQEVETPEKKAPEYFPILDPFSKFKKIKYMKNNPEPRKIVKMINSIKDTIVEKYQSLKNRNAKENEEIYEKIYTGTENVEPEIKNLPKQAESETDQELFNRLNQTFQDKLQKQEFDSSEIDLPIEYENESSKSR